MTQKGKLPPQALDLEEAVLGAMLLESRGAHLGGTLLKPHHFYDSRNTRTFEGMKNLQSRNEPIDLLTIVAELKRMGRLEEVGGAYRISQLTDNIASSANIEYHCKIIIQKYIAREGISIGNTLINDGYNDSKDSFELIDDAISSLHDATNAALSGSKKDMPAVLDNVIEKVLSNQQDVLAGVPTGIPKYDANTGGQQDGGLIIYAARPAQGKTARMCNEARHQLKQGLAVAIHSLEMTPEQIICRIVGLECGIEPGRIERAKLSNDEAARVGDAVNWVRSCKLQIFEGITVSSIVLESSMMQATMGLDIIYVDYLQIATAGYSEKYKDVSAVSMAMKQLAKSLSVPVVCLAQLSRAVENRPDKVPQLSDLKESGQIEQDADVVEFLFRPETYGIFEDESSNTLMGQCHYINGKMRSGTPHQTTVMKWEGGLNRLTPIESVDFDKIKANKLEPNTEF